MNGYDPERRDRDGNWGMHHVLYDDNDLKWYNFNEREFRVVGRSEGGGGGGGGGGEAVGGVRPLRESLRGLGFVSVVGLARHVDDAHVFRSPFCDTTRRSPRSLEDHVVISHSDEWSPGGHGDAGRGELGRGGDAAPILKGDVIEWRMNRGDRREGTVVRVSMLGAGTGDMEIKDHEGEIHYGVKPASVLHVQRGGGGGGGGRGGGGAGGVGGGGY